MNHDACHCFDYDPAVCPDTCYRAQLTADLKKSHYPWPVAFSNFKNTIYCSVWPVTTKEEKE